MAGLSRGGRIGLLIAAVLIVMAFAVAVRPVFTPFFIAGFAAYLLYPPVCWLEKRRGLSRNASILVIYAVLAAIIGGTITYGLPPMVAELNYLAQQLPQYTAEVERWIQAVQHQMVMAGLPPGLQQVWSETVARGETAVLTAVRRILDGVVILGANALDIVLIPVMAFYLLRDAEALAEGTARLAPHQLRPHVVAVAAEIDRVLRGLLRGYLLVSLIVGALTSLGLYLIGMNYSLLIGVIAAIADLIPYFGPLIGLTPVIIVALLDSPKMALSALGVIVIVQQLENNFISPKILADAVGMHPLVVIFSLLAGGHLFGIVGLLLAVPVVAVGRVIVRYVFLRAIV
ncbi:AI-2E family transporter [Heliophilum fasciatum]|uniref:Putative PurR-regulated permease PerM n=1 Tax=Heliophilum fasciatum TaxID=35700 RepID=A0A4R2RNR7_9FIRM|nr:AI-2E family transporter [Heliophilum fasciatum]MCW2278041.1 putative PurR-regulated permease PerM [Heliophilum fasciatum]TCP64339.1 putative PurR-regulated permease PerM [Heliophilum fasciatum]